jgi:hypothetical protein
LRDALPGSIRRLTRFLICIPTVTKKILAEKYTENIRSKYTFSANLAARQAVIRAARKTEPGCTVSHGFYLVCNK